MSRPALRRALRRAGLSSQPKERRDSGPRSRGTTPPPRVFLPGESVTDEPAGFEQLFGRVAPVEIEIGTGRGRFIFAEAREHPERNFLGIEVVPDYVRIAQVKIARLGLSNLRVEWLDGREFVKLRLATESVHAIHVYFSDPWPKKRHHKRRVFQPDFVEAAASALVRGGLFMAASDHLEYWEDIVKTLDACAQLERLDAAAIEGWQTGTDYEKKFLAVGRTIGKGIWRKRHQS
jgi:tRNA (guanine-N7-)-methyltransferase